MKKKTNNKSTKIRPKMSGKTRRFRKSQHITGVDAEMNNNDVVWDFKQAAVEYGWKIDRQQIDQKSPQDAWRNMSFPKVEAYHRDRREDTR